TLPVGEITHLAGEVDTALGVVDGLGREIQVRPDVPVVRQLEHGAVARGGADIREQEAALALRADRKRHPRQVEDGYALELHPGAVPRAGARTRVDFDLVRVELPVHLVGRAGGEGDALE